MVCRDVFGDGYSRSAATVCSPVVVVCRCVVDDDASDVVCGN